MTTKSHRTKALLAALTALGLVGTARSADGYIVRYNIAGSLGGEIFTPPNSSGTIVGAAYTDIDITKINGSDGKELTQSIPGGAVPLPSPTPSSLYPSYSASTALVHVTGRQRALTLAIGHVTPDLYGGGRIAVGVVTHIATKSQDIAGVATPPALSFDPAVNATTQTAVTSAFNSQYLSSLAAQGKSMTGEVSGLGDTEVQAGWIHATDTTRMLVGGSLIIPTGQYSADPAPDIGQGNFYTLRPTIQMAYLPTPKIALAGKLTLGLNTKNRDNQIRSGNWAGLEAAVGYMTPYGPVGLQTVAIEQYQDDANNSAGASRYKTNTAGLFFTTKLPVIDTVCTVQFSKSIRAIDARYGTFSQIRFLKLF